jgi:chaperone modulatory protein CbpM
MITIEMIGRMIPGPEIADLERWIAHRWIRPEGLPESGGYVFREIDVARVRLIAELRYDLHIDEETLPVVLSLIDQLYGLRTRCGCCMRRSRSSRPRSAMRSRGISRNSSTAATLTLSGESPRGKGSARPPPSRHPCGRASRTAPRARKATDIA